MSSYNCENIVIGSGISALGTILGLIKKYKKVCVIDPLIELEKINSKENKTIFCKEKLPLPYSKASKWKNLDHFKLMGQKLYGGHSSLWGGNSMRFTEKSILEWPLKYNEMEKYYNISEKVLNVKHYNDDISKFFKIKKKYQNRIKEKRFLNYKKNDKIIFGKSRISKKDSEILNVKDLIEDLKKNKKIKLIKGQLFKFNKKKNNFRLFLKNSKDKIFCKRLFIAAGPLNTKKLIKRSINTKKKYMKLKQSQGFLVPAFLYEKFSLKKQNDSLSDFHLIYRDFFKNNIYMEMKYCPKLIEETFKKKYGLFYYLVPKIIFKKILIIWGFIPSQHSFTYKVTNKKILIKKNEIHKKKKVSKELNKVFALINKNFNFFVLNFLLKFTQFGRGYHIGGNLPMTKKNSDKYLTTNKNGVLNLKDYKNLFIVDSSIFSTIPSSSIGLSLFANAFRIASNSKTKIK